MLRITRKDGYKNVLLEELNRELFHEDGNCYFTLEQLQRERLSPHSSPKTFKKDINGYEVLGVKCTGLLHDVIIMVHENRAKCFMCGYIGPAHEGDFFYVTNCDLGETVRNHLDRLSNGNAGRLILTDFEKKLIKYKDWYNFMALID